MSDRVWTEAWSDYELIDAGGGKKLERWGSVITIRPEVQAYFRSELSFTEWKQKAHWEFIEKGSQSGIWKQLKKNAPSEWIIGYQGLKFQLRLTKFKHLGLFPEQRSNWDLIQERIERDQQFLNLFAYTGAASLMARKIGADTFHVDSVRQLITWAKANMDESRLLNIRWVHDDASKFAAREQRREKSYHGIIMDPPAWGLGAKKEKWKLEDKLDELMSAANELLVPDGLLIVNTYSPKVELKMLKELANLYLSERNPKVSELWMKTSSGRDLFYGNVIRT